MSVPIRARDIRVGDLIDIEWKGYKRGLLLCVENRADGWFWFLDQYGDEFWWHSDFFGSLVSHGGRCDIILTFKDAV